MGVVGHRQTRGFAKHTEICPSSFSVYHEVGIFKEFNWQVKGTLAGELSEKLSIAGHTRIWLYVGMFISAVHS